VSNETMSFAAASASTRVALTRSPCATWPATPLGCHACPKVYVGKLCVTVPTPTATSAPRTCWPHLQPRGRTQRPGRGCVTPTSVWRFSARR
jgi:hypothetical protein